MSDNVIIPCPSCAEQCSVAQAHLDRRLACPHCGSEFVPSGGGGGGGRSRGRDRDRDRERDRGGMGAGRRRPPANNNAGMMAVGGVLLLLVLILGVAYMGGRRGKTHTRRRKRHSDNVVHVSESTTPSRADGSTHGADRGGPRVDPDTTISLSTPESGSYAVNGNVRDTLMTVRVWKDPQELSHAGKKGIAGRIPHQGKVEALGVGTNQRGIKVYKIRGKSKYGTTIQGYVSAFYIEKDNHCVAEHVWEWMDHDELARRGKED